MWCWCRSEADEALSTEDISRLVAGLPSMFLFAVVWSIGATCDNQGRLEFDTFLRQRCAGRVPAALHCTVHDSFWPGCQLSTDQAASSSSFCSPTSS